MLNRCLFSQRTSPTHEACHYIDTFSINTLKLLHANLQLMYLCIHNYVNCAAVITNVFQLCNTCTLKIRCIIIILI